MKLKNHIRHMMSFPPHKLVLKVLGRAGRQVVSLHQRRRDIKFTTYMISLPTSIEELLHCFHPLPVSSLGCQGRKMSKLSNLHLSHHFDVLGSGWIQVKHGISCPGLESYQYKMGSPVKADSGSRWLEGRINQPNLAESQRIWSLVDHDYIPIDWHLDFKSGYRWAEDIWHLDVRYAHKPGVDIKVPWELARMQHLPLLAWAYALACDNQGGFASLHVYSREFRNQVLDFIATNPPRFGVNWCSPMDVGIRVANWLVAYDIFQAYGAVFDNSFKKEFFCSIYQHGLHIVKHLEWSERNRGNHYLSNIASLLFVAAYLPCSAETNAWLAFGIQELVSEVEYQFTPDGANFEASTSYHRLSAEMVTYATALILGLPDERQAALRNYDCRLLKILPKLKPAPIPFHALAGSDRLTPFPPWYIERLEKMAEFTMHITKPNGHIPQIGDNDSGRFFKLQPVFESKDDCLSLDENYLDYRHLVAAMNGLFGREDFTAFTGQGWLETEIVRSLAGNTHLPSYFSKTKRNKGHNESKLYAYSGFGFYIYRSKNMYLAVRCGSIGQKGNGGHAHNDNLSFELNIKGRDFIVDGGSYLYTPLQKIRNDFRSTSAHNTLAVEGYEQNRWRNGLKGLFSMMDDAQAHLLVFNEKYLRGEHNGFGRKHYREFKWQDRFLLIEDAFDATLSSEINFNLSPCVEVAQLRETGPEEYYLELLNDGVPLGIYLTGFNSVETADGFYSLGYGKRVKNQRVRCHRSGQSSLIKIDTGSENYQG